MSVQKTDKFKKEVRLAMEIIWTQNNVFSDISLLFWTSGEHLCLEESF